MVLNIMVHWDIGLSSPIKSTEEAHQERSEELILDTTSEREKIGHELWLVVLENPVEGSEI